MSKKTEKSPKSPVKASTAKVAKVASPAPVKVAKVASPAPVKVAKVASPAPVATAKAGRPDDDAMHAGTKYSLTDVGKSDASALANGVVVGLRCKVAHGESVRWLIRAAIVQGIADGKDEHAALTTHVNQTVAKALHDKGRAHQCKHANGEPVKWRVGDDARLLEEGGLLTILAPKS